MAKHPVEKPKPKPKAKTYDDLLREQILQDAKETVEAAKHRHPVFPEPVKPHWKN